VLTRLHLAFAFVALVVPLAAPAQNQTAAPSPAPAASNTTAATTSTQPVEFQAPPEQPPPLDSETSGLATAPGNATTKLPPVNRSFPLTPSTGHLFGTWGGALPYLESQGITPSLNFTSDMAGNPVGGITHGFTAANNLGLGLLFDLDKIASIPNTTFLVQVSERFGPSLTKKDIGNVFNVQQDWGGQTIRVVDVALQPKLLNNTLQLRVGRIAAGDDFLVSHYDYLFMQNGFCGNPVGIFFNAPGMTAYPNAAWGVLARFKPTKRYYLMGAVYDGDPSVRANAHHGMDWSMHGPAFYIAEAGYQFNGQPGDTGLLGNYKVGAWYDNAVYPEYSTQGPLLTGQTTRGNWGFYTLFDQMVYRFDKSIHDQGIGIFGSFLASPNQNTSQLPYFFTAGVAALGLFPGRPNDSTGFGVLWGGFSNDLAAAQQRNGVPSQNSETALELTHRLLFYDGALFIQPDIQYIIHPGGTGTIANALVLGAQIGLNF
jgi:porin